MWFDNNCCYIDLIDTLYMYIYVIYAEKVQTELRSLSSKKLTFN